MLDAKLKTELRLLVILSLEGQATDLQFQTLNDLLKSNQDAFDYYLELIEMHHTLQSCDWRIEYERLYLLQGALEEFAVYEQTAPEIKIVSQKAEENLILPVQAQKPVRKISKGSLFTLVSAAAAVILIFVFARFAPQATGLKVAVVSDCIDAQWADTDSEMKTGAPVFTSRGHLVLREGYAKLLFDNQAQVTIEAPAKFQILAEDKIHLRYGRIYAVVGPEAIGFMITTQNAKVIDLGTEFGVEVNPSGDTSLHVMKGKTTLIAGEKSNKLSMDVIGGVAKKVSADSQAVSDISCDECLFARNIDSANGVIQRGETQPSNDYIDWTAESGNWSDDVNWDTGIKPDGTRTIRLRKSKSSVCTLSAAERPIRSRLTVSNGQTFNIENSGSLDCGWARFGWSTVNMTGNGTLRLNNESLLIGCPIYEAGPCVWTMSDTSTITINEDADNEEFLCISQDNAAGTLKLVGSGVTVNCKQLRLGYVRYPGFAPRATLEYVMDAGGVSTIHVDYKLHLSEGDATSHLVMSATEPLPGKDLVLIETKGKVKIIGDGVFDTLNGAPAPEGTPVTLGGNHYTLTYQYEANGDGCRNDVALVLKMDLP